jgi:hypothetical protein
VTTDEEVGALQKLVDSAKMLQQDSKGDTGNCFMGSEPIGRVHRFQVAGFQGMYAVLFCVRCGKVETSVWRPM